MVYTRQSIWKRLDDAAMDMQVFYQCPILNYRGRTADTQEYFTEVAAQWLLEHYESLGQIRSIRREASYRDLSRNGSTARPDSNRWEERIAMAMKRQGRLPVAGQVLDYQTPLKNEKCDPAGKIDLLTYDGHTLRIMELKMPDSKETMLRCVLEGYTYLKTVDGPKLLSDFHLPADTVLAACPLVFEGGAQQQEMQEHRPHLRQLMAVLGIRPFYTAEQNGVYTLREG